jgi:hypothetical protein
MRALCGSVVICSTDGEMLAGKEKREKCWLGKMFPSDNKNDNDIIIISYNKYARYNI